MTIHNLLPLLQLSIDHHSLNLLLRSHARIHILGLHQNSTIITKLISAYSICKKPLQFRAVFDSIQHKNLYFYNTLIHGYSKNCLYNDCFYTCNEMCRNNYSPDEFTFSILSKVSGEIRDLFAGKTIHCKCLKLGLVTDTILSNSLMSMYCKCGLFDDARKVFDEMPERNISSWNTIITGFSDAKIWNMLEYMQEERVKPNAFTVSSLLPMCGLDYGRELHCYIYRNGLDSELDSDAHLGCCLVDMYCKSNRIDRGRRVFDQIRCKNVFTWTAMINGYVQIGDLDEGLFLFRQMQEEDRVEPSKVSLVSILPACSSVAGLVIGKQIHGFAVRKEFIREVSLCNALIDMYSKCGSLKNARKVFDYYCIYKDEITWSSMISGYGLNGKGDEAVDLYNEMLTCGTRPDSIILISVLSACSRSGLVNEGLEVFNNAVKDYEIVTTVEMCACVVDLLGKSGQLDKALHFIEHMNIKPTPSIWGALVSASVQHGDMKMKDLAYKYLIEIEPLNPSNFVSVSNSYASSRKWEGVAEIRTIMREKGMKKLPGCSWIIIGSETHSFFVSDKSHPQTSEIYDMLDGLVLVMKSACEEK